MFFIIIYYAFQCDTQKCLHYESEEKFNYKPPRVSVLRENINRKKAPKNLKNLSRS